MGACVSADSHHHDHCRGVLVLGLDGAGATTILYQLVLRKRLETIPTLGVNHEIVSHNGLELECWDIGGLDKIRPLWAQYYRCADAVIFVVDASDKERMRLAASEVQKLYSGAVKRGSSLKRPLLVFANKQDSPGAKDEVAVEAELKLKDLGLKSYKVFKSSADDRESLLAGVQWITEELKKVDAITPAKPPVTTTNK